MANVKVKVTPTITFSGSDHVGVIYYQAAEIFSPPGAQLAVFKFGAVQDPTTLPYPTFVTMDDAIAYFTSTYAAMVVASLNALPATPPGYYTTYTIYNVDPVIQDDLDLKANEADLLSLAVAVAGKADTSTMTTALALKANTSSLAPVATSGTYNDLSGKPSIPAAQIQSDWSASSGVAAIANKPTIPSVIRTTSALSLSLVGSGATGTQISSTKDSTVRACVSTSATASISGGAVSSVDLKICSTNSATEGIWTTVATSETNQSYSLAIAIQGVTGMKEQLCADVPAGWYVKLVNSGSGTHAESFISGQKTIYG